MSALNFGQANALASKLNGIDEYVMEIRSTLLLSHLPRLTDRVDTPTPERQEEMLHILDTLVQEIQTASAELDLKIDPVHVARKIHHRAALLSAELGDARPESLIGYGRLDPVLAEKIGASVKRITTLLDQL
jgi:hypothetical protein